MGKHGIVILGHDTTTGFGKTRLALRLAVEWAIAYNHEHDLPKTEAKIVFTNTIDVARDIVFQKGFVWVIDDMKDHDKEQVMYLSENGLKVWLKIMIIIIVYNHNSNYHNNRSCSVLESLAAFAVAAKTCNCQQEFQSNDNNKNHE